MLLGPVFSADLVTLARRSRYIWLRVVYVGILAFVLWTNYWTYLTMSRIGATDTMANLAASFFSGFAWVQLIAVLVFTPALVAGTIAMERERRTLEYLLATDLTNLEIVGGKLAS